MIAKHSARGSELLQSRRARAGGGASAAAAPSCGGTRSDFIDGV